MMREKNRYKLLDFLYEVDMNFIIRNNHTFVLIFKKI